MCALCIMCVPLCRGVRATGMLLIYRNPSLAGYPQQLASLDLGLNVQDTAVELNATEHAQLLLVNLLEYEDVAPPSASALYLDAYLGACTVHLPVCELLWR
jgi:hypothetical protein